MNLDARSLALIGLLLSGAMVAAEEAEIARLRNEYPAAAKRLQDRYARVNGSLTVRDNVRPGAEETRTSRLTFAVSDGHYKLERHATRTDAPNTRRETTTVVCFGPRDAFTLLRPSRDKPFTLNGRDPSKAQSQFHSECGNNVFAPFQLLAHPLTYYLEQLDLSAVEPLPDADGGGLRVTLKTKNNQPLYVDVDPSQGWIIRRVEVLFGPSPGGSTPAAKPLSALTTIDYQGKDSVTGLPLPKTIRQYRMSNLISTTTIDSLRFEPTPAAEFTLAHYGLSAPPREGENEAGASAPSRLVPWLVGLGVAGVAGAVGLYRLASGKSAAR